MYKLYIEGELYIYISCIIIQKYYTHIIDILYMYTYV